MTTRSLLTLTLVMVAFGCKNQDQGRPAEMPQGQADASLGSPPPDLSQPAAGHDDFTGTGADRNRGTGQQQTWGTTGGQGQYDENQGQHDEDQGQRTGTGQSWGTQNTGDQTQGTGTGQSWGAGATGTGQSGQGMGQSGTGQTSGVAGTLSSVDCSTTSAHRGWSTSAPQGATCKEVGGALVISAGDGFYLTVREMPGDMAGRKKTIEADQNRKFKRYTTDTPDAVVYETDTGTGKSEYGFYATHEVGNTQVVCEGQKGRYYTQAQAEAMVRACQALTRR